MPIPKQWEQMPVITQLKGWQIASNTMRNTYQSFHKAGIKLNAVWLDYEGEPSVNHYSASKNDPLSKSSVPSKALENEYHFHQYKRQLWVILTSSYFAAAAREAYPACSVTNWTYCLSSPEDPVLGWYGSKQPPMGVNLFTATNPVAYGMATSLLNSKLAFKSMSQDEVNRFYFNLILRQASANKKRRAGMRVRPAIQATTSGNKGSHRDNTTIHPPTFEKSCSPRSRSFSPSSHRAARRPKSRHNT